MGNVPFFFFLILNSCDRMITWFTPLQFCLKIRFLCFFFFFVLLLLLNQFLQRILSILPSFENTINPIISLQKNTLALTFFASRLLCLFVFGSMIVWINAKSSNSFCQFLHLYYDDQWLWWSVIEKMDLIVVCCN